MLFESQPEPTPAPAFNITERQQSILKELDQEPMNVDRLIETTGLEAGIVLQELTFLTLKGQVKRIDGQMFARRK